MKEDRDPLQDLFDRIPRPRSVPGALIAGLVRKAVSLFDGVPASHVSGDRKRQLSGYLFWEGPTIVREVADGLAGHRSCFPEIPNSPAEMREGLRRAVGWLSLREFGRMLVRISEEHYAFEMATQVRTALQILRHVRADRGKLYPGPRDKERAQAMSPAEDTLASYRRRVSRRSKKK